METTTCKLCKSLSHLSWTLRKHLLVSVFFIYALYALTASAILSTLIIPSDNARIYEFNFLVTEVLRTVSPTLKFTENRISISVCINVNGVSPLASYNGLFWRSLIGFAKLAFDKNRLTSSSICEARTWGSRFPPFGSFFCDCFARLMVNEINAFKFQCKKIYHQVHLSII